jgi:hypothetical protein
MVEDFKKATDELFRPITQKMLATHLKCSIAAIRQARLAPSAKAHRSAPENWEEEVSELALSQAYRLLDLHQSLKKAMKKRK